MWLSGTQEQTHFSLTHTNAILFIIRVVICSLIFLQDCQIVLFIPAQLSTHTYALSYEHMFESCGRRGLFQRHITHASAHFLRASEKSQKLPIRKPRRALKLQGNSLKLQATLTSVFMHTYGWNWLNVLKLLNKSHTTRQNPVSKRKQNKCWSKFLQTFACTLSDPLLQNTLKGVECSLSLSLLFHM